MTATFATTSSLTGRAQPWLSRAAIASPQLASDVIPTDHFDRATWDELPRDSKHLARLVRNMADEYNHGAALVQDVFQALYQYEPAARQRPEMVESAWVNHRVVTSLQTAPDFTDLRDHTVADQVAAGLAVLALEDTLRMLLAVVDEPEQKAEAAEAARGDADGAAKDVAAAVEAALAAAGDDGVVPDDAADAVELAIAAATAADEGAAQATAEAETALAKAGPAIDAAADAGSTAAAQQADEDAAHCAGWDLSPAQLRRMNFAERAAVAQQMRNHRMAEFAHLIGRFRRIAAEMRAQQVKDVPGQITGITAGADLLRLVPNELTNLVTPVTRALFAARMLTGQLIIRETSGTDNEGRGAIIACVDGSFSMEAKHAQGITREVWAKAVSLTLLDQARAERRDFVGIHFAGPGTIEVFRFPRTEHVPIERVLAFGDHFFRGGTHFETPLSAAQEILEAEFNATGRQRGDIVFITDGACQVSAEWEAAWHDAKRRLAYRAYAVGLGKETDVGPDSVLAGLCNSVHKIDDLHDPRAPATAALLHSI